MGTTFEGEDTETRPEFGGVSFKRTATDEEETSSVDVCVQNRRKDNVNLVGVYVRQREKQLALVSLGQKITYSFRGVSPSELDEMVLRELDGIEELEDPLGNKNSLLSQDVFQHCYPAGYKDEINRRIGRLNNSFYPRE